MCNSAVSLLWAALLLASSVANAGAGDNEASVSTAPGTEEVTLPEVVVTARKRAESQQQVPISVVSLDGDAQRRQGVDDLSRLGAAVPGLQQGDLAITSRLSLRGVNSGDNNAFEQAVGVYVDGVYRGRMNQQHIGLFDIERVEVLKGPQVALYGNSSIGGAISVVTRKPGFDFGGELRSSYESEYQTVRITGGTDLPVHETLAFRLAGSWRNQNRGLWPNQASGQTEPRADHEAFRLGGLWLASDALSVGFRHERGRFEREGHIFDVFKHVDGQGNPWPGSPFTGLDDGRLNIGNGAPFLTPDAFLSTQMEETAIEINYDAERFSLTSISSHSRYEFGHSADVDLTPATLIGVLQREDYRQLSQELRVDGQATERLSYLAGLYFQRDDFRNDYYADFNLPALLAPAFGLPTELVAGLVSPFTRHILLDQQIRQAAVFGHLDFALSDQVTASLGARWQQTRKRAHQAVHMAGLDHRNSPGPLIDLRWLNPELAPLLLNNPAYLADPTGYVLVLPDGTQIAPVLAPNHVVGYHIVSNGRGTPHEFGNLSRRERQPMLQASLAWQQASDLMLYASWSNGAKAGGFDFLYEGGDRDEVEYEDEKASVFELGLKKDWPNLRINLAAFHGRYDNLQVSVFDGGIGFTVGNAASSTSRGVDGELLWRVGEAWRIKAHWAWVDFRYDHFPDANCSTTERLNTGAVLCDWSGRRTPFVPTFEGALAVEHSQRLGDWAVEHSLQWRHKGDHATASDSESQTWQRGYGLLDYRIDLQRESARWGLALHGRNLTDRQYNVFTSVIPLAPGGAFAQVRGPGRELALELRYRF